MSFYGRPRLEKNLQAKVWPAIRKQYGLDVWYYHPRESAGGRKGVLDCILCFYGLFVVIEIKRDLDSDGPTPLQKHNIKLIKRAHGFAFAADTLSDVMAGLNAIYLTKIKKGE